MAAGTTGRNIVIKIGDGAGSEVFTTIAAARDCTITESDSIVTTTSKDDGGVRTLLAGLTERSMSVSGTGVFVDSATIDDLRTDFRAGTLRNFRLDVASTALATDSGQIITGAFRITQFEIAGAHDDAVNYNFTLESSGALTIS